MSSSHGWFVAVADDVASHSGRADCVVPKTVCFIPVWTSMSMSSPGQALR